MTADVVMAHVGVEAEGMVGLNSVHTRFLQGVCLDLVMQADAPALLPHIQKDANTLSGQGGQGHLDLLAAVASKAAEDIPGHTFTVDPHED